MTMHRIIHDNLDKITALCKQHNVRSLFAFGSKIKGSDSIDFNTIIDRNGSRTFFVTTPSACAMTIIHRPGPVSLPSAPNTRSTYSLRSLDAVNEIEYYIFIVLPRLKKTGGRK